MATKVKITSHDLEDLQTILEEGISLVAHVFKTYRDIIEAGGELTVAQEKALTSHITCLYQTNKDYRATKREIDKELYQMDENQLKEILKIGVSDSSQDHTQMLSIFKQ